MPYTFKPDVQPEKPKKQVNIGEAEFQEAPSAMAATPSDAADQFAASSSIRSI